MSDVDKADADSITLDEFTEMCGPKMQTRDTREEIMKVFGLFDDDGTGAISFRNLKRVAAELGEVRELCGLRGTLAPRVFFATPPSLLTPSPSPLLRT